MENDEQLDSESTPQNGIAQVAATCMCMLIRDESCAILYLTLPLPIIL